MTLGLNTTLRRFLDPMVQNGVALKTHARVGTASPAMAGLPQLASPWLIMGFVLPVTSEMKE